MKQIQKLIYKYTSLKHITFVIMQTKVFIYLKTSRNGKILKKQITYK